MKAEADCDVALLMAQVRITGRVILYFPMQDKLNVRYFAPEGHKALIPMEHDLMCALAQNKRQIAARLKKWWG